MNENIAVAIGSLISGGAVTAVIGALVNRKKVKADAAVSTAAAENKNIERLLDMDSRLFERIAKLEERVAHLEQENNKLREENLRLREQNMKLGGSGYVEEESNAKD